MSNAIIAMLSGLSAAAGVMCLYFAFLLTEPEERLAQETLEKWWVVMDDLGNATSRRAVLLAVAASRLLLRAIDVVFPGRVVSFRGVWTASCFSITILVFGAVIRQVGSEPAGEGHSLAIYYALFFLAFGFFPLEKAPRGVQACGCAVLALTIGGFAAATIAYSAVTGGLLNAVPAVVDLVVATPAIFVGIALHLFWAAFLRWSIIQYRVFENWARTLLITAVACAVLGISVFGPKLAAARLLLWTIQHRDHIIIQMVATFGLVGASLIAVTAAWPLAAYFIAVALHLLLRATSSLVPRFLYAAQRHKIISNHTLLATVGVALLIASGIAPLAKIAQLLAAHV